MPNQLKVSIYNSAGERVLTLFDGVTEFIPVSLSLSGSLLAAGQGSVSLNMGTATVNGQGSLAWQGNNDTGQYVESGMYYYKVEFTDPFGTVSATILSVNVLKTTGVTMLEVFNSAGELVASKDLSKSAPGATDFAPLGHSFSPSNDPSEAPSTGNSMRFEIQKKGGGTDIWDWNGRNASGALVESGTYTVRLTTTQQGGQQSAVLRSVTVVKNGLNQVNPAPYFPQNPLPPSGILELRYLPQPNGIASARLNNVAGELVALGTDPFQSGRIGFSKGNLASGIYLVEFELLQGRGVLYRKLLKVSILR